jgi:hypothetical protein
MKGLWQKVVPMVRCWKILVPLRLEEDFEAACSLLAGDAGVVPGCYRVAGQPANR